MELTRPDILIIYLTKSNCIPLLVSNNTLFEELDRLSAADCAIGLSPITDCMWVKEINCHAGNQEVGSFSTRCESEEPIMSRIQAYQREAT